MAKAKEYGQQYLDKLLAKLPAEERDAIKGKLAKDDVFEMLGEDVLMKSDYTKKVQEAAEEKDKYLMGKKIVDDWAAEKQPIVLQAESLVAENAALKERLASNAGGDVDTTLFVSKVELEAKEKLVEQRLAGLQNEQQILAGLVPTLTIRHYQKFNEVLDTDALFKHVRKVGIPLDRGGYDDFVKDRTKELETKDIDKRIADARREGEEKGRMASGIPYPVGENNAGLLFPKPEAKGEYGASAAVAELMSMRKASAS